MVIVWSIRNNASPQELQSQELGGRKAGLERGRESLHSPSIQGHHALIMCLWPPHGIGSFSIVAILGMLTPSQGHLHW